MQSFKLVILLCPYASHAVIEVIVAFGAAVATAVFKASLGVPTKLTVSRLVQPVNVDASNAVKEVDSTTDFKDVQPLNTLVLILVRVFGKTTVSSDVQF